MFKLFNKNKVGEIILKDGNYTLYKTSIENLKILNCINWNKNRPYDKVRVDDIKRHYIYEKLKVIPV
jgi:hypothetical protein